MSKLFADENPPEEEPEPVSCALKFQPDSVFWAMQNLPVTEALKHFLISGATGSGKTIAIRLFLQSIAPRFRIGAPNPEQLIIFDAKSDTVPLLAGLGIRPEDENVWILNPYDANSAVWSLSEATQSPAMARAFATLVVPEEKGSTAPYFADAARELVYAVILGMNEIAAGKWTFRDLLCALDSRKHIEGVSARDPRARILATRILRDDRHSDGVLSTLGTKLGRFEQVAALWDTNRSGRKFSIDTFFEQPGVLILGNDPVLRESFWPINAILLKALTNEILRRPDSFTPRHWFVLDEFRAMQRIDCIHDLLNMGRSKGASVLLGVQSIEGLIDLYNEHGANDLLSQCANKMFLRAGGHRTAEWAENYFSKVRHIETDVSQTQSQNGRSTSVQRAIRERSMFLASYFLDLPFPVLGGLYHVVCDVPWLRETLIVQRTFDSVLANCIKPLGIPAVVPRNRPEEQRLLPWDPLEEAFFCNSSSGESDGTASHPPESPPAPQHGPTSGPKGTPPKSPPTPRTAGCKLRLPPRHDVGGGPEGYPAGPDDLGMN